MEQVVRPSGPVPAGGGDRRRTLRVTADDFGFGVATSAGIVRAHLDGPVTATSVMVVTGEHVKRSVELLAGAPRLEVGLHLVFTDVGARPLAATRASGLVGRDGRFRSNGRLWLRVLGRRQIDPEAVFDEVCGQAEMFRTLVGRRPTHVDGHHHAHQLPGIREAVMRAMDAGVLPAVARVTVEPPGMLASAAAGSRLRRRVLDRLGRAAAAKFRDRGVRVNDYFFGVLSAADLRKRFAWEGYLARLPDEGSLDWMVHPGLYDETLPGRDAYVGQRVRELEALTDGATKGWWERVKGLRAAEFAEPAMAS